MLMKRIVTEAAEGCDSAGRVSSLWLLCNCTGSYAGSLAGAAVFDVFGFQASAGIEALVLSVMIFIMITYSLINCRKDCQALNVTETQISKLKLRTLT